MTTGRVALPSGASQPAARKAGMMPPVMSEEGTSAVTFDMRMQGERESSDDCCGSSVVLDPVIVRVAVPEL